MVWSSRKRSLAVVVCILTVLALFGSGIGRAAEPTGRATVMFRLDLPYEQYLVPVAVSGIGDVQDAVRALIAGPPVPGPLEPVLPADTVLLGVETRDGVAYVNLSHHATHLNVGARGDEMTVAAIVNTVGWYLLVDRVQILIDGEAREAVWGHVDTSRPLAPTAAVLFPGFPDVRGHWAEGQILAYCLRGTIAGYPDGTYRPSRDVTRAEFTKILVGALGLDGQTPAGQTFTDVAPSHWAYPYVQAAVEAGVISPADYGQLFGPGTQLGRREMAVLLVRAAGLEDRATALAGTTLPFSDAGELPGWAVGYIAAVNEAGLMIGYPDNTFRPQSTTTRAETAVVVSRILNTSKGQLSLSWPHSGRDPGDRVLILGAARVYEGTVQFRLVTEEGTTVSHGFTTATDGGPSWGVFGGILPFAPGAVAVEAYWQSAEDGSDQDVVGIGFFE